MRVSELTPAFVLHTRAYRDSSMLLELITRDHGRVSAIARGVRKKTTTKRGLLQLFVPIMVSWSGRAELMTLREVEPGGLVPKLQGSRLYSALYLNELLVRLLQRFDPYPRLYQLYAHTLLELANHANVELILRVFEKRLLQELGYGLQIEREAKTGNVVQADSYYHYSADLGLSQIEQAQAHLQQAFLGAHLQAIAKHELQEKIVLQEAKRLTRLALAPLLGKHTIKSRELFRSYE